MAENGRTDTFTDRLAIDGHTAFEAGEIVRLPVQDFGTENRASVKKIIGNQGGGVEGSVVDIAIIDDFDRRHATFHRCGYAISVMTLIARWQIGAKADGDLGQGRCVLACAARVFDEVVTYGRNTAFGRAHGFAEIRTLQQFREAYR